MTNNYSIFTAAVLSMLVVIGCGLSTAHTQERHYTIPSGGDFHPPRSAAEKTLDQIVRHDNDDAEAMFFLLGRPYRDASKDNYDTKLFTPELKEAASKAEAEIVARDCDGVYRDGELCGLGFNPIICAQDTPDHYLYRVEQQTKGKAVITLGYARNLLDSDPYPAATYSMIQQGKNWVMDGILCQGGLGNFNFSDFDAIKRLTSKPREQ